MVVMNSSHWCGKQYPHSDTLWSFIRENKPIMTYLEDPFYARSSFFCYFVVKLHVKIKCVEAVQIRFSIFHNKVSKRYLCHRKHCCNPFEMPASLKQLFSTFLYKQFYWEMLLQCTSHLVISFWIQLKIPMFIHVKVHFFNIILSTRWRKSIVSDYFLTFGEY